MKIRLEGTEEEINDFLAQSRGGQLDVQMTLKSISKFYPNSRGGGMDYREEINQEKTGRVYVELE